ncbi:MAG: Gfo/Idh/MocA family oxidoreductase [Candidatus Omnitrophica bacterium]|nr:Gfo/Idh/MocA family oxidoreductase [Candidatus Omnitrophota bacterium]
MIHIGVIGCGYWGPGIIRNFQEFKEAKVAAACDLSRERLKYIKGKYPAIRVTTDYKSVLRDSRIDAVAVVTPVGTHFRLGRETLESGKHLLIEKPITTSSDEAKYLIDLANKKKKVLMVDHTFVYTGAVKKIKEIIEKGRLGRIYYFDSVRVNLGLFQHDVNVIWDLAPHDIAIMDYLLDETPVSVSATGVSHVERGRENIAYIIVRFKNSVIAHFHVNWMAPVKVRLILIGGSKRMIVYDDTEASEKVKVYDKGVIVNRDKKSVYRALIDYRIGDMYAPHLDQSEALKLECADFVKCVLNGTRPVSDGHAGLRVVKVLEAAQKSMANSGMEINV